MHICYIYHLKLNGLSILLRLKLVCIFFLLFLRLVQTVSAPDEGDSDPVNDGKVSYMRFLHKLGVTIKPGDIEGISTQIHQSSNQTEVQRRALHTLR